MRWNTPEQLNRYENKFQIKFKSLMGMKSKKDCWLWTGNVDVYGYGRIHYRGILSRASRLSYQFFNGPLEEGNVVRHKCDVPLCVNPAHLDQGTQYDNSIDAKTRGRLVRGSQHWRAKLNESNVHEIHKLISMGLSNITIALEFGVHRRTIDDIRKGKTWGWL